MAANTRRTGQNDKQFQLQTTPSTGRRTKPQRNRANSPKEGDVTTKEGNKFIFNNGAWRLAPKAPKLPSPAEAAKAKPEANSPKNGDTTIKEGHKFVFKDGKWLKATASTPKPAAKPSPAPSASRPSTPAPTRSSGSTSSTSSTSKPSPKPVPKPAGKVPASSETYRDGGKGLYQGSKEYRDKVGGSGNPLLNRFRQDMGRDADSGSKAEPKMSKPEDKSNYVASNGKPYMGPAFGSGKAEPAKPASPASPNKSEKGMTLAERMRRQRMGMA